MNTNRDKAVSFGRDGGDLRGSQSGISPVGYVNNDKLRLSGYLFR